MTPVISVNDLNLWYGPAQALHHVTMDVQPNTITALIGPSGCGKSTFLKTLNRMNDLVPGVKITGQVLYNDQDIFAPSVDVSQLRREVGMVFQSFNLFANKTALQNVTEGLIIGRKMPKAEAEQLGLRALEKVGLGDRTEYYPSQLSGGQQQRVAIARALAAAPAIILADEPTGNLDSKTSQDVLSLLKVTSQKFAQTIVMITHNEEIAQMADRIIRIEDGRIVSQN